jgi:hypothetical protein
VKYVPAPRRTDGRARGGQRPLRNSGEGVGVGVASGAAVVYVATGDAFSDALAGTPAAAEQGGRVLLVSNRAAVPSAGVTRTSGGTRYETAPAVSAATFGPGVARLFIATGEKFADALAAGPAAAHFDGPILPVVP